ncbi:hypothetical protein [Brevibacterium paucivorans]|uniref:hypothetical protein n=1 Tax=Brevibacterium paucivorans TaxID=170994 RepID=UPI00321A03E3
MMHPDVQEAVMEVCEGLTGPEHVYTRLQMDFANNLPAVLVMAEQNDGDVLAEHRVDFEVYGVDLPATRALARVITSTLADRQHATSAGMLDPARVESPPKELPYPDPSTQRYSFTLVIPTRAV